MKLFKIVYLFLVLFSITSMGTENSYTRYITDWDSTQSYNGGDLVEYSNKHFIARHWSKNTMPVIDSSWAPMKNLDFPIPWRNNTVYDIGDVVLYNGGIYISRHWNENNIPPESNEYGAWVFAKYEILDYLPLDPGDSGKNTFEGIDSDSNGIRDDIQRLITFNFPDNPTQRASMLQLAKSIQNAMFLYYEQSQAGSPLSVSVEDISKAVMFVTDCQANKIMSIGTLEFFIANTDERNQIYHEVNNHFSGAVYKLISTASPIDSTILNNEITLQELIK